MNVRLDSVCDIIMGQAPAGDEYNDQGEGLPLLAGAGDFKNGRPVAKKFTRVVTKQCIEGDLVIGIRASIGDKVIADRPYCLGRGVAVIRPKAKDMAPRYLWHWMTAIRPELERKAKGATFKQVNRADIGELRLALPPLDEQRRIAAILDQAEELRAKRRAAIALLDQLPQAIFLEMFGEMTGRRTLAELADLKRGPFGGALKKEFFVDSGYKVYEQGNVIAENFELGTYFIDERRFRNMRAFEVATDDLLVSCSGTLGRIAQVPVTAAPGLINQALLRVRARQNQVRPTFLRYALKSDAVQKILAGFSRGSGLQNFPPMPEVRALLLPTPDLATQDRFIDRVEAVHRCKCAHQSALVKLDALFTSLQYSLLEVHV